MKNLLLYNYNIDIDDFENLQSGDIAFYIDYNKFYFLKVRQVKEDIKTIYDYISKTINNYHYVIKNRFNDLFTEDGQDVYILLKVNGPEHAEITLYDIVNSQVSIDENKLNTIKRNNWNTLWSEKIDYLEYQISELGKNHPIVLNSFSYYVGLAENAIEYFNLIDASKIPLVLSHKRVTYPNISLNYNNPLNLVVDYRIRDISEYIKSEFFEGQNVLKDLTWLVGKNVLSSHEYNLLYARLLYPSYYFDTLTYILEKNTDEDKLLKYIDKVVEYEILLKSVWKLFSRKCSMFKIEWLTNKKET